MLLILLAIREEKRLFFMVPVLPVLPSGFLNWTSCNRISFTSFLYYCLQLALDPCSVAPSLLLYREENKCKGVTGWDAGVTNPEPVSKVCLDGWMVLVWELYENPENVPKRNTTVLFQQIKNKVVQYRVTRSARSTECRHFHQNLNF